MKIGKTVMQISIISIMIVVIIIIISYINHRLQLKKEEILFTPLGDIVEVNGNKMSVFIEGEGKNTLVFMSGGGTSSPILDFKSLYSQLSDDYKIVVIEKFGYGFSDIVDEKRDIDSILAETRDALSKAGIEGPYILCPHSMSGIEAIYWAQQYPQEVKAIVGLDMAVPNAYSDYHINMPLLKISSIAVQIGITRFIPGISESDAIKHGNLNKEEKEIYRSIFYRRTATKTMLNEAEEIKNNALIVKEGGNVDSPILMFCSNGKGTGWSEEEWEDFQYDFIKEIEKGNLIKLECSHYVHNYEYEKIAEDIRSFLEQIDE
ncbi:alpha/beta hydrolase [Clostridium sp. AL.422]|uniref:alpha/beta fold hydrolase n=1 Tax=Clostridium TaxID=1485 RepID=UPI00293DAAA2|nr:MULTISPECIES: alpha/beta hydrolase [unclassified Clostridium]MDV4149789.1 alpha/beta hydrolase [Clostridium sp. AL.422]